MEETRAVTMPMQRMEEISNPPLIRFNFADPDYLEKLRKQAEKVARDRTSRTPGERRGRKTAAGSARLRGREDAATIRDLLGRTIDRIPVGPLRDRMVRLLRKPPGRWSAADREYAAQTASGQEEFERLGLHNPEKWRRHVERLLPPAAGRPEDLPLPPAADVEPEGGWLDLEDDLDEPELPAVDEEDIIPGAADEIDRAFEELFPAAEPARPPPPPPPAAAAARAGDPRVPRQIFAAAPGDPGLPPPAAGPGMAAPGDDNLPPALRDLLSKLPSRPGNLKSLPPLPEPPAAAPAAGPALAAALPGPSPPTPPPPPGEVPAAAGEPDKLGDLLTQIRAHPDSPTHLYNPLNLAQATGAMQARSDFQPGIPLQLEGSSNVNSLLFSEDPGDEHLQVTFRNGMTYKYPAPPGSPGMPRAWAGAILDRGGAAVWDYLRGRTGMSGYPATGNPSPFVGAGAGHGTKYKILGSPGPYLGLGTEGPGKPAGAAPHPPAPPAPPPSPYFPAAPRVDPVAWRYYPQARVFRD